MALSILQQKADLRNSIYKAMARLTEEEKRKREDTITEILISYLSGSPENLTLGVYFARDPEPDLIRFIEDVLRVTSFRLCAPVSGSSSLLYRGFDSLSQTVTGRYGIREPEGMQPEINPDRIFAFLVPGIAFDRKGYRLGRGKGYFDRLFAAPLSGKKIGICFGEQFLESVPHERRDIPMDTVITDEGIYSVT